MISKKKDLYGFSVFINCPFDKKYLELRNALVFVIFDCGFIPRCALEEDNSANVRFIKIKRLIEESRFGVHDISRVELDGNTRLPRFNMPFELGVFVGAMSFGQGKQKAKNCLILDKQPFRYQKFISDIAGQDIKSHGNSAERLIKCVRDWLNSASKGKIIPGGKEIFRRYKVFKKELPKMCKAERIDVDELTFDDYSQFVSRWLRKDLL